MLAEQLHESVSRGPTSDHRARTIGAGRPPDGASARCPRSPAARRARRPGGGRGDSQPVVRRRATRRGGPVARRWGSLSFSALYNNRARGRPAQWRYGLSSSTRSGTPVVLAVFSESTSAPLPAGSHSPQCAPSSPERSEWPGPAPQAVHAAGPPHHLPLRLGPVLLLRQQPDVRPLQHRGQMTVLGLGVSRAPPVRPAAARPGPGGFPAACGSASRGARERGSRASVGRYLAGSERARALPLGLRPFGVGRRDQAHLAIEGPQQIVEVAWGVRRIPRRPRQVLVRPHVALDVGAALGSRALSTRLGGLLVDVSSAAERRSPRGTRRRPPRCRRPP